MKHFDQSSAKCRVFTYKEGVLSAFGYDLRIKVNSFVVELEKDNHLIKARFKTGSLHVDCALVDGIEQPDILTGKEKKEIDVIIKDLLDADKYKDIVMVSSSVTKEDSTYLVRGELTLHGKTREISFTVKNERNYHITDCRLHLPDFGIRQYSSLFGALKIKPDVLVRVEIPEAN